MPGKGWKKAPDGTWTPPNQMVHTLQIEEDTQEFIRELANDVINKVLAVRVAGKGIEAVGETIKGAVSHPVGFLAISAGIVAYLLGVLGFSEDKEEEAIAEFKRILGESGLPKELLDAWEVAFDMSRVMFPFIPGFPSVGEPPVPPLTPEEKRCHQLLIDVAVAKDSLGQETDPALREQFENRIQAIIEEQAELGC